MARTATPPASQPALAKLIKIKSFQADEALVTENEFGDDRPEIHAEDPLLLIVDNDLGFAQLTLDVARTLGFKGIVDRATRLADSLRRALFHQYDSVRGGGRGSLRPFKVMRGYARTGQGKWTFAAKKNR